MYQCNTCLGLFSIDEIEKVDCNGDIEPFTEEELELNSQNPDWCVKLICQECKGKHD